MGTPTRLGAHFFMGGGLDGAALLLGEDRRYLRFIQMIQHSLHQQMHPVSHAAERQGYGAA